MDSIQPRYPFLMRIFGLSLVLIVSSACQTSTITTRPDRAERAAQAAKSQQARHTERAQSLFLQANEALDNRQWSKATQLFTRAHELAPERWDILMNRAIAQSAHNQFRDAIGSIELSLQVGGDQHAIVFDTLGNIYQNRGLYGESIDAYRMAASIENHLSVDRLLNIGAGYLFLNDYENARITLEKSREIAPNDARPHHSLALLFQAQQQWDQAIEAYLTVHKIAPEYALSYYNRGQLLYQLERFREAIEALERYLELEPNGPNVRRAKQQIDSSKKQIFQ